MSVLREVEEGGWGALRWWWVSRPGRWLSKNLGFEGDRDRHRAASTGGGKTWRAHSATDEDSPGRRLMRLTREGREEGNEWMGRRSKAEGPNERRRRRARVDLRKKSDFPMRQVGEGNDERASWPGSASNFCKARSQHREAIIAAWPLLASTGLGINVAQNSYSGCGVTEVGPAASSGRRNSP